MAATVAPPRRRFGSLRRALLVAHIAISVALLGDVAGFVAVAIRATLLDDPAAVAAHYDVLAMFSLVFGIPLSFGSLLSGVALGLVGKWGVLRYWWTIAKLAIIVSVILVGAFMLGPSVEAQDHTKPIAGAAYDVAVLLVAVWLSVYKPGGRRSASMRS